MKKTTCPEPLELMIWLDQETEHPELIAEHLNTCPHCRGLVDEWQQENLQLSSLPDSLPCPDLTQRIMAQILPAPKETGIYYNVLWGLLLAMTTLAAALTNYLAWPLWRADSWAVAGAKAYAALVQLYFIVQRLANYLSERIFTGEPLLPALCLTAMLLLFNLIFKRRYSHV